MSLPTSTLTLLITVSAVYPSSYAMDVDYTLVVSSTQSYTSTQYTLIPFTTSTESIEINGVLQSYTATNFITGTQLTTYLNNQAPVEQLVKTALADQQAVYLYDYIGSGTVYIP